MTQDTLPLVGRWQVTVAWSNVFVNFVVNRSLSSSIKLKSSALFARMLWNLIPRRLLNSKPRRENPLKKTKKWLLSIKPSPWNPNQRILSIPYRNKGSFNFDEIKWSSFNEDEDSSFPYFCAKFDPENYSIWFNEYKYIKKISKVFMSCSLITVRFQRLDKIRKLTQPD